MHAAEGDAAAERHSETRARRKVTKLTVEGQAKKPRAKSLRAKTLRAKRSGKKAREKKGAARRDAIINAAIDEFAARGFAATRLDDVARRAGIAKGTIYLYFRDKENLFQEIVRAILSPTISTLERAFEADVTIREAAGRLVDVFVSEVMGTRRKDVIRLVIAEGARFPHLAEIYYREIMSRVLVAARSLIRRAHERGEIKNDALLQFPQLLGAPAIVAIIWNSLFQRFEPLDAQAFMRAYVDILFDPRRNA